jgi:hypothetical protein
VLEPGTSALFTCIALTGTSAASWQATYAGSVVASGKVLTVSNSLTLAGTDGTTQTFPNTSATLARTDAGQTFTGTNVFGVLTATSVNGNTITSGTGVLTIAAAKTLTASNSLTFAGVDGKTITHNASQTFAGTDGTVLTFQGTDTYVGRATTDTLTNKTFDTAGTGNVFKVNGTAVTAIAAANGLATLDTSGKLSSAQIPASLVGALQYQGTWNATTNVPVLVSSTGTKGQYYKVATAGTTAIDGNAQWNVGDTIVFDGTVWDKIDGVASEVVSVAGLTGVVTLAASNLTNGVSGSGAVALVTSPALLGTPTAPTAALSTNTTQVASTAFVLANSVSTVSPAFTGVPTAPTATAGTNTTQLATTAFVLANGVAGGSVTATGGSAAITLANHFGYNLTVMDFGAAGNGTTADDAAINATIAGSTQVVFPAGTYKITTTATWAAGKVYIFMPGATLAVATGVTLTIAGSVVASPYKQLFTLTGTGKVQGIRDVYAEWWGAVANGTTGCSTAINAAIASVQNASASDGSVFRLKLLLGTYLLDALITFTIDAGVNWRVEGAGGEAGNTIVPACRLLGKSTVTTHLINVVSSGGGDFRFSDFSVINQTQGTGASIGIYNSTNAGRTDSKYENIFVSGFATNWYIDTPTRLVKWDRSQGGASIIQASNTLARRCFKYRLLRSAGLLVIWNS